MNEPLLVGVAALPMNQPIMNNQNQAAEQQDQNQQNNNNNQNENEDVEQGRGNSQRNSVHSFIRDSLRLSQRQQNRINVRNNFRGQIEEAINESIVINALFLFISVNKMIAYIVLGKNSSQETCKDGQLCIWLKLMFLHDALYSIHLITLLVVIFIHRHRGIMSRWSNMEGMENDYQQMQDGNNQVQPNFNGFYVTEFITKKNWFNSFLQDSTKLFYLIIFIQGNLLIFYNEEQYLSSYPNHFYLALVYVIMGYFYLGIPLFFFASICLCMPFMLVIYLVLRRRRNGIQRGLDEDAINSLPIKYLKDVEKKEEEDTLECCICLVEYEEDEEIIILPCNKKHHFHAKCIKQWVKINGVCPICKRDLKELLIRLNDVNDENQQVEMQEVHQNQNIQHQQHAQQGNNDIQNNNNNNHNHEDNNNNNYNIQQNVINQNDQNTNNNNDNNSHHHHHNIENQYQPPFRM
ncbi:hypothetical protein ABPG74_014505 [Tetrahymena malaccensis]